MARPSDHRDTAPYFVHEFALALSGNDEKRLRARFEAARQAYNALLHEALRRRQLLIESRGYANARKAQRGSKRTAAMKRLDEEFGFRKYDLHKWASIAIGRSWIGSHIDAQCVRAMSSRAFHAVRKYHFGRSRRPRPRGSSQFNTVSGTSNVQGIRYSNREVIWVDLRLPVLGAAEPSAAVRHVRLVRRAVKGRDRYFAQLVCAGLPTPRAPSAAGIVGIDPGTKHFGIAAQSGGHVVNIAAPLGPARRALARLQRAAARKRRLNNAENYRGKTMTRGRHTWRISRKHQRLLVRIQESYRKMRAHRATTHGQLTNAILKLESTIQVERTRYAAMQKVFGRTTKWTGPGLLVRRIAWRALTEGRTFEVLPTSLRLSQTCHGCGEVVRKPLRIRVHQCSCGVGPVQRDAYSAWLATFAIFDPDGSIWRLDADQAKRAWKGAGSHLAAALTPIGLAAFETWVRAQVASDVPDVSPTLGTERLAEKRARESE